MAQLYFIAIVLPEELNRRIAKYKHLAEERWNCKVALRSPAHITILPPFWMDETLEQELIAATNDISSAVTSFTITTANFSAFRPRTIFIAISTNDQLGSVKEVLDQYFKEHKHFKAKPDGRPFHPHITIATRDLHKASFAEAWDYFKDKEFCEEWMTTGLRLLRYHQKKWDVIHTSQFK